MLHNPFDKGSPLKYGHAPDGSEMIWQNVLAQDIPVAIESIAFDYRYIGADVYDDDEAKPTTTKASLDAASDAIVAKLTDLEKAFTKGHSLIVTAIIIACAFLYFVRH
jgi:hypothetical protein